ncbi:MAG TPA: shikimate dehydrogenase [Candidatus Melainabacteria bacterium]|nr:shikimate dehydrogenase [Candidatus Melainabacteria bacterium]
MSRELQVFLLLGLIGHPVSHSLSPAMHLAAMKHIGRDGDYRLIDVVEEELDSKLASLHREGYAGFNVTIPHKRAIFARCIGKSEDAVRTGAVNTVKLHPDGKMIGHNTDLMAFRQALEDHFGKRKRRKAIILGAGGAARAAVAALVDLDFQQVNLLVRNPEKHSLSDFFCGDKLLAGETFKMLRSEDFAKEDSGDLPQLIVNCTPLGQSSNELPSWADAMFKKAGKHAFFFDMVYSKSENPTPMIEIASKHRLESIDGKEMLARQAAAAFEFWTDKSMPLNVMLDALNREIAAR